MFNIKILLSGAFLLLLSLPAMADAHVDCDGNGSIDLVCEGSMCHHEDGATGYCACAVTPNGPGPVKSCLHESPSIAGDVSWQSAAAETVDGSAEGDHEDVGEADVPETPRQ